MKWNITYTVQRPASPAGGSKFKVQSSEKNRIRQIINVLLANRGLKTKKEIDEFLHPQLASLDASLIGAKELAKAIKRVREAISKKEKIIVYSDYDADGICGAAICWETLNKLGADTMPYVPKRIEEGYGLSIKGIDNILSHFPDTKLIITVDHGITAVDQVAYAKEKGIDVIITDHHTIPSQKPDAFTIVHTTKLSGSGVALLFSHTLLTAVSKVLHKDLDHVGLVALGTIADLVPLTGFNRIIAKFGLEELNKTKRVGLQALIKESGLQDKTIGTYEVSHVLSPRINASGRLTHALDSLRLLCTKDRKRAYDLARNLNTTNIERQTIMDEATQHAKTKAADQKKLIFVSHESYHEGVIGLVAGRLVEEFYRPAIVVAKKEKFSKASARSVSGFNIIETIRKASDLLVDCGGHPMAAGFTIETEKIDLLQRKLSSYVDIMLSDELLERALRVDMELPFKEISLELYKSVQEFQPFGIGNPEPTFAAYKVEVVDARTVGSESKHLKLLVKQGKITYEAIGFGMGHLFSSLSSKQHIDIAYTLLLNQWNGREAIQLKIKDMI